MIMRLKRYSKCIVYVTYDGILEPLGKGQIIGYLKELSTFYSITILSFEKISSGESRQEKIRMMEILGGYGISWLPLNYHKSPRYLAKIFDFTVGLTSLIYLVVTRWPDIIHARSYFAAVIAMPLARIFRRKLIFDIRGFWIDERRDIEGWSKCSYVYRIGKYVESILLNSSDQIITLTNASVNELIAMTDARKSSKHITVIPTCVDHALFYPQTRKDTKLLTFGWVGSVGPLYLLDEIFSIYLLAVRRGHDCRLIFINRDQHKIILSRALEMGILPDHINIQKSDYQSVRDGIVQMTVGTALYLPTYSRIATSPTRLAEYLACGIPCYVNKGCGDLEEILKQMKVGVVLSGYESQDRNSALESILEMIEDPTLAERCIKASREIFSLEGGVQRYRMVYENT